MLTILFHLLCGLFILGLLFGALAVVGRICWNVFKLAFGFGKAALVVLVLFVVYAVLTAGGPVV